ncbi:hypothetical protein SDC9_52875 [bioreactor metagenome]|uniref:Uncharacterized protein n=1 Tax=bioreactor metagenome TaxID=1076179 RepID=A0A644WX09_9ZZZZ
MNDQGDYGNQIRKMSQGDGVISVIKPERVGNEQQAKIEQQRKQSCSEAVQDSMVFIERIFECPNGTGRCRQELRREPACKQSGKGNKSKSCQNESEIFYSSKPQNQWYNSNKNQSA